MIFVTVGAQMPFDRLVSAVDAWAAGVPDADVFAQIGPDAQRPRHFPWTEFMRPEEFRRRIGASQVVVAHAGMGTILTALEHGRPIIVMPRRGDLAETRNDHQVATAARFGALAGVAVVHDARELAERLDRIGEMRPTESVPPHASPELLRALRAFVADAGNRRRGARVGR